MVSTTPRSLLKCLPGAGVPSGSVARAVSRCIDVSDLRPLKQRDRAVAASEKSRCEAGFCWYFLRHGPGSITLLTEGA